MDKNRKCPVCKGEFEDGFLADSGAYGGIMTKSLDWAKKTGLLTEGNRKIISFRCKNCGYLESYAK